MDKKDLLKLIEDDDLGLLNVKPKQAATTTDERLLSSFQEINNFVKDNGREPKAGGDINEHQLYARLNAIRENKEKIQVLSGFDEYDLLRKEVKEIKSLKDVFEDDDLGILESDADSIFNLKHVPKEIEMPDYIANRKPCKNFKEFEQKFIQCQADLKSEKRKLWPFRKEQNIEKGSFFVLKGVLVYVAEVGEFEIVNGKKNARLRCIFENGTESDLLLRSLARELYRDGRRVTEHDDHLLDNFHNITDEDKETGFIYVLRSLSDNPEIKSIENLYKIGFSKTSPEERIKNASQDPTYLMAPVSIVTAFKCFNMNPQKLEQLLHTFFGSACLNVDVFDGEGKRYIPREWFIAPISIIEQAINFILNGNIIHYYYDADREEITGKNINY
jgi:hypothetical protein